MTLRKNKPGMGNGAGREYMEKTKYAFTGKRSAEGTASAPARNPAGSTRTGN